MTGFYLEVSSDSQSSMDLVDIYLEGCLMMPSNGVENSQDRVCVVPYKDI